MAGFEPASFCYKHNCSIYYRTQQPSFSSIIKWTFCQTKQNCSNRNVCDRSQRKKFLFKKTIFWLIKETFSLWSILKISVIDNRTFWHCQLESRAVVSSVEPRGIPYRILLEPSPVPVESDGISNLQLTRLLDGYKSIRFKFSKKN